MKVNSYQYFFLLAFYFRERHQHSHRKFQQHDHGYADKEPLLHRDVLAERNEHAQDWCRHQNDEAGVQQPERLGHVRA